jgi:hypothetical protein
LEKERDTVKREVNEPLELPKTEESLPELNAEFLTVESPVPAEASGLPQTFAPRWLLLAYAVEFLIALIAILDLWSEVGGQGHLDLMPWYIKLALLTGSAWCCVRFTAAMVEQNKAWTRRTIAWFTGIMLFAVAMGAITYYYHLSEAPDDGDQDSSAAAFTSPGVLSNEASIGIDC